MPDYGKYEKVPRPESVQTLIKYLKTNTKVAKVEQESEQIIQVTRVALYQLRIFMTNIYTVSLADVYEIIAEDNQINAIVTMSAYNSYTADAKEFCKEKLLGLFEFKEFLGAVYYDNNKFLNYLPPSQRK